MPDTTVPQDVLDELNAAVLEALNTVEFIVYEQDQGDLPVGASVDSAEFTKSVLKLVLDGKPFVMSPVRFECDLSLGEVYVMSPEFGSDGREYLGTFRATTFPALLATRLEAAQVAFNLVERDLIRQDQAAPVAAKLIGHGTIANVETWTENSVSYLRLTFEDGHQALIVANEVANAVYGPAGLYVNNATVEGEYPPDNFKSLFD